MHSFQETRIMPYKAELIRDIILDIEKYPEFLPWCKSAKIMEPQNESFLTAELVIGFNGFVENYVSKVMTNYEKDTYIVEVVAISGPFQYLNNVWKIKQLDNGTKVDFSIDFAFKSKILGVIVGMVFSVATEKMVGAFESRANKLLALL